ncbi:hypothetical protein ACIBEA_41760 [Streptomyces sp. NPDC051555]
MSTQPPPPPPSETETETERRARALREALDRQAAADARHIAARPRGESGE